MVFLSGTYWVCAHQLIVFEASDAHIAHIREFSLHRGDSRITMHLQSEFKCNVFLTGGTICSHTAVKQLPERLAKWQQYDSTMSYTLELPTSTLQPNYCNFPQLLTATLLTVVV